MSDAPKRFPTGAYIFWLVVIVLLGCWPLISWVSTWFLEPMFGCTRGIVSLTCTSGPAGIGSLLDTMGLMGWLFVFTAPIGLLLFAIWLGVLVVHVMNAAGRRRTTT